MNLSAKNVLRGSQVIPIFLSKSHPNCQLAHRLDWQKQFVKLRRCIIFLLFHKLSYIFFVIFLCQFEVNRMLVKFTMKQGFFDQQDYLIGHDSYENCFFPCMKRDFQILLPQKLSEI